MKMETIFELLCEFIAVAIETLVGSKLKKKKYKAKNKFNEVK